MIYTLSFLQTGCSAQTTTQKSSETENQNHTVLDNQTSQKSGNHYIVAGVTPGGAESFEKVLGQAEVSSAPILNASRFEREEKWDEAIQAYQEALAFDRHEGAARLGLARIYEKTGNYGKAVEQLEMAMPKINDWAKPEYEKKLTELKSKATQQAQTQPQNPS